MISLNVLTWLNLIDTRATLIMNFNGGRVLDIVFYSLSNTLSWIPLLFAFLYLAYKSTRGHLTDMLIVIAGLAIAIFICDKVSAEVIKPLVMRLRPSHTPIIEDALHYVNDYRGGRYGFVSSHAANAFGCVVYASFLVNKRLFTHISVIFATLVGYSRIYLGVHYLGDVVCGAILGAMIGTLVYVCVESVIRLQMLRNTLLQQGA